MAHSPRKPSPGRKPAPSPSVDDLFSAAGEAAPDPAPDSMEDVPTENWTLDDGPATPAKPVTLPPAASLPAPGAVRISPISVPEKAAFESNPSPPAESIPEALPVLPRSAPAAQPGPAPRPAAEAYDPFEIDDDLPPVAPGAPSDPVDKVAREIPSNPAAEYHRVETADEAPVEDPLTPPRPAGARQPAGLIAAALVLIALLGGFIGILYLNRPASEIRDARAEPTVPLAGNIVTLSAIESGWRSRQPGDLVSTVDVTLPTPSRQQSALLPMVRFTVDPAATKAGFLRFIFFDPDGKISGDVRVVKVNGGTIEPLSSGAVLAGPGTAAVYGSLGFMDRPGYMAYATGDATRWFVEVSESTNYNAKQEEWNKLETFDLSNASDP